MIKPHFQSEAGVYLITCLANQKFYIGSSCELTCRFNKHLSDLEANCHDNDYLQHAWNKYGGNQFVFGVLEYSPLDTAFSREQLYGREQYYLDKFRPHKIGFNISPTAWGNRGTKMSAKGRNNLCLAWQRDKEKNITTRYLGLEFEIVSPKGIVFKGQNITQFAREHGLHASHLADLLRGKYKTVKGWHLPSFDPVTQLKSPDGIIYSVQHGTTRAFCQQHGLCLTNLRRVVRELASHHKGWTKV